MILASSLIFQFLTTFVADFLSLQSALERTMNSVMKTLKKILAFFSFT